MTLQPMVGVREVVLYQIHFYVIFDLSRSRSTEKLTLFDQKRFSIWYMFSSKIGTDESSLIQVFLLAKNSCSTNPVQTKTHLLQPI